MTGNHIGTGGFPAIEDTASGGEVQERFRGMKLEDAKALLQEEFRVSASRAHEIMRLRKAMVDTMWMLSASTSGNKVANAIHALDAALKARGD